jgi:hypothetical protein
MAAAAEVNAFIENAQPPSSLHRNRHYDLRCGLRKIIDEKDVSVTVHNN